MGRRNDPSRLLQRQDEAEGRTVQSLGQELPQEDYGNARNFIGRRIPRLCQRALPLERRPT